jgi:hypothetical protein
MFKVLVPIESEDKKTKYWARLGTAFTNKDASINCYLDTVPLSVFAGKELMIQIRELDEDELRRREERRGGNGHGAGHAVGINTVPF